MTSIDLNIHVPGNTNANALNAAVVNPVASKEELRFAATEAQLEIWLSSQQSVEANCACNEITSLKLSGDLDRDALSVALKAVIARHDSLRAMFSADGTQMIIQPTIEFKCDDFDWSDQDEADLEISRLKLLQAQACIPFDLQNGPLFRASLQKTGPQEFYLTVAAHHIVLDGWSLGVLVRDLGHFYDAARGLNPEKLPAAISYQEHSKAMTEYFATQQAHEDEQFWMEQFEDLVPGLDLPIESKRPALRTYFARRYDHHLSAELMLSIKQLGAKAGCSVFNTLLTAFESFVARISNNHEFCVGIPTAGQLAMDQPELIGHCVNTMPYRAHVDLDGTFNEQLKKTRSRILDAFDHQRYTFGKILSKVAPRRDPSRAPMLAISFNVDPAIDTSQIGFDGLDVEVHVEPRMFENFEWFVNGIVNADKSVDFQVQYNTDLFSSVRMESLFNGFEGFLTALILQNGECKLGELPVLSIEQREKVLVEWNQTERNYTAASSLHAELSRQANLTPDNVAVQFGEASLTYRELEEQSNRFANFINGQGVGQGDLVGICVPRSELMLTVVFGILKSGAGYVPLDPAFPADRLKYMCDHSGLKLVVGADDVRDLASSFGKPIVTLEQFTNASDLSNQSLNVETKPGDTCYVIYTSGSTGIPKGVDVPHGAVVNFLYSMAEQPGFTGTDKVLAVTTLSFDISVLELYLPLLVGGTTVVMTKEATMDGGQLIDAIDKHGITLFQSTPATLRMMIAIGWKGKKGLKVLCGGEPMPTDLVKPLLDRCAEFWNMYGPTETTVWSSVYRITDAAAPILIGKPIANTQIYLLDQNMQPVPVGSDGEIYIGGAGVTLGYLNQADLTSERFVENRYYNPFVDYCNHRLYKTGDLGRYRRDGNIQFLRRNDKQVKVRGFRIELGEIESALKSFKGISQAVAIVREDNPGDTRLVAYWIAERGFEASSNDLRNSLRDSLPYYMVPQHFVQLDAMPETANRKIDYNALPAPNATNEPTTEDELQLPATAIEKFVASVWQDALEIEEEVELNDNFFDLGGHSLLVMKAIAAIEERTGAKLAPPDFLMGTLEQLADKVNEKAETLDGELATAEAGVDQLGSTTSDVASDSTKSGESTESTGSAKTVTTDETPSTNVTEKQDSSPSLFKRITGFWD